MELAHEESIEDRIISVKHLLESLFKENEIIKFSELIEADDREEISLVYIPLLFLASRQEITLTQKEMFQEIYIKPNGHHEAVN